jgi:hypothetical protein
MGLLRRRAGATRVTAEGVTIPSGARDVREVYPDPLTTRQRWLLGLGALMLDPKHGSCARLHPAAVVHPERTARQYRASLKSLWEIDDLSSLLRALTSLLRVGHRGELTGVLGHPPLAWDVARVAVLPRRAFAAGYIDESTAWELMEAAADAPYRVYDSWGSYVRDTLAGRNAWAGRRHDWMDQHVLRWWSPDMRDESPWQSVPWPAGRLPARPETPAARTGGER